MTIQNMDNPFQRSMSLQGKVVLVVGGYGAIGTTIAKTLANAGATSIVAGRNGDRPDLPIGLVADSDRRIASVKLDACDAVAIHEQIELISTRFGPIDVVVNCIGRQIEQSVFDVSVDAFWDVLTSTLQPAMLLTQAVGRHQRACNVTGSHIHLLSLRSFTALRGRGYSAFASAKGAHVNLIRQQAVELAEFGIRVNGIAPGAVLTAKNADALSDPATLEKAINRIPLRRLATPNDVAAACLFLASDAAAFITGQVLVVDGGQSAHQ